MHNRRSLLKAMLALGAAPLFGADRANAAATIPTAAFDYDLVPAFGNPHGDVTIVEFFDYQCGYCREMYKMLHRVVAEDGNIRLVMKDWTVFGPDSVYAATAVAAAAKLGRYRAAHDALMRSSGRLSQRKTDALLSRRAGIDEATLAETINAYRTEIGSALQRNDNQARGLRLKGTPTFLMGDQIYSGALYKREVLRAIEKVRTAGV
ncbi:protein-disulfide isomerase [Martelella radicis]|uniref:Protein-disulfide isomerase n=2 Tax=Martelella radicis TaxID=1397476 RepID=A0A7W6KH12_9HYPH|nr:protein-disulfide isomerase [Martelella radicis]